jgi:hypothetical protein
MLSLLESISQQKFANLGENLHITRLVLCIVPSCERVYSVSSRDP